MSRRAHSHRSQPRRATCRRCAAEQRTRCWSAQVSAAESQNAPGLADAEGRGEPNSEAREQNSYLGTPMPPRREHRRRTPYAQELGSFSARGSPLPLPAQGAGPLPSPLCGKTRCLLQPRRFTSVWWLQKVGKPQWGAFPPRRRGRPPPEGGAHLGHVFRGQTTNTLGGARPRAEPLTAR